MKTSTAAAGTVIFTIFVPAMVAGALPHLVAGPKGSAPPWAVVAGWALVTLGTLGYLWCAADFVRQGVGTPAPIAAPDQLVVRGLYHLSRNPMYVSVLLVILGQAALRWSVSVLVYGGFVLLAVSLFVVLYEEPALTRRFGDSYLRYRQAVPRWIGIRKASHP